jgi:hypothetical protein
MTRALDRNPHLGIRAAAKSVADRWNRRRDKGKIVTAVAIDRRYRRLIKKA